MKRILVIEDDPGVASFLRRGLKLAGFEVAAASGGAQGLALLETFAPDLVMLDRMMVGMDGLEVLGKLCELRPGLPVIMLSGRDPEGDEALRASAYLVKPVAFEVLLETVQHLLSAHKA